LKQEIYKNKGEYYHIVQKPVYYMMNHIDKMHTKSNIHDLGSYQWDQVLKEENKNIREEAKRRLENSMQI
jgi:hypothetical protein